MARTSTVWIRAAQPLLVLLFAVNVYRAATQSITADEAFTYNTFLAQAPGRALQVYDANNHVLHTLLCRVSTAVLGLSEFSMRVPALLGGALYLWMVFRLSRRLLGAGWLFFATVALLALNPFILDFLSAARGYSLALGLWLWGLEWMLRYLESPDARALPRAGLAMGLAVAANLAFAVPVAALAGTFVLLALGRDRRFWPLVDRFALPGIVCGFVILVVPLSHAHRDAFYFGSAEFASFVDSLVMDSLATNNPASPAALLTGWFLRYRLILYAIAAAALLAVAALAARKRERGFLSLGAGSLFGTLAALVIMHRLLGVAYPSGRTGIYWVPLLVFVVAEAVRRSPAPVRALAAVAAMVCVVQFVLLFRVSYYGPWRYDAGSRRVVAAIRARENGGRRLRIGGNWEFEPALNFYRRMYRLNWEPVDRGAPDRPADYRVLNRENAALADKLGWQVLYRDPASGAVLAK